MYSDHCNLDLRPSHKAEDPFAATVRERIEAACRRRDPHHLRTVYNRFLDTSSDVGEENEQCRENVNRKMTTTSLAQALNELQVGPSNGETMEEICLAFDANRNGLIDYDEFVNASLRITPIEAWCKQINWWRAIADAIPPVDHCDQPLRAVALLTDHQIDVVCAAALKVIRSMLHTKAHELSEAMKMREEMGSNGECSSTWRQIRHVQGKRWQRRKFSQRPQR